MSCHTRCTEMTTVYSLLACVHVSRTPHCNQNICGVSLWRAPAVHARPDDLLWRMPYRTRDNCVALCQCESACVGWDWSAERNYGHTCDKCVTCLQCAPSCGGATPPSCGKAFHTSYMTTHFVPLLLSQIQLQHSLTWIALCSFSLLRCPVSSLPGVLHLNSSVYGISRFVSFPPAEVFGIFICILLLWFFVFSYTTASRFSVFKFTTGPPVVSFRVVWPKTKILSIFYVAP